MTSDPDSELVDLWRKNGQRGEMSVHELLGRHPRTTAMILSPLSYFCSVTPKVI